MLSPFCLTSHIYLSDSEQSVPAIMRPCHQEAVTRSARCLQHHQRALLISRYLAQIFTTLLFINKMLLYIIFQKIKILFMFLRFTHFLDRYIDNHEELYVERLREVVAIKSVSAWPDKRPEVIRQVKHTAKVSRRTSQWYRII